MNKKTETIAFIGGGNVAKALSSQFLKIKKRIVIGARNPDKTKEKFSPLLNHKTLSIKSIDSACEQATIIFYTAPWEVFKNILCKKKLEKKILVDCTNPLKFGKNGFEGLAIKNNSVAEMMQNYLPKTSVIKAFNSVSLEIMKNPIIKNSKADIFICGNDSLAKKTLTNLVKEIDFNPLDIGNISFASHIEALTVILIQLAFNSHKGKKFFQKIIYN